MSNLDIAKQWLSNQKDVLDSIIAEAAQKFHADNSGRQNYAFDLKTCNDESFRLVNGMDICYDRYTIGISYSTWYHARRVNTLLLPVLELLDQYNEDRQFIDVFDLGAGTGAVLWSLLLSKMALQEAGKDIPNIHIKMLDASPFMLEYNHKYLMPIFFNKYPACKDTTVELTINSWVNDTGRGLINPWIFASYVFDHNENYELVEETFGTLVQNVRPDIVVLSTSKQTSKTKPLNTAVEKVKSLRYSSRYYDRKLVFGGYLNKTYQVRSEIQRSYDAGFRNRPSWDRDKETFQTVVLEKIDLEMNLDDKDVRRERISMYQSPIMVRSELKLNNEQIEASIPKGRPTIIIGPAGCGKSVIITERIKLLFEQNDDPSIKILLTTFNKELVFQLYKWSKELLREKLTFKTINKRNPHYEAKLEGSTHPNLYIMHFDILPTRLTDSDFKKQNYYNVLDEYAELLILRTLIDEYVAENNISKTRYKHILDPRFILNEYVRIIYGMQECTRKGYLNTDRTGRGNRLKKDGTSRQIVWNIIVKYLTDLSEYPKDSFTTIRHKYFKSLTPNGANSHYLNHFDHILVDEFQDCTQTDYEMFYRLLRNPDHLVIAGDHAQSVHLQNSSSIPREQGMGNFDHINLNGSYRLPMWVSHGVKPLSAHIRKEKKDTPLIQPFKGAPPGARIMLIYGNNEGDLALKIIDFIRMYNVYYADGWNKSQDKKPVGITVLEKDSNLCYHINKKSDQTISVYADTILKIKGLEKKCIIWSTRLLIDDEGELYHHAYTILTRTAGLCVIALFNDSYERFLKIVDTLERDFISLWDNETEMFYRENILNKSKVVVAEKPEYD